MLKYVFLSCKIIFEMFSLKPLSVLCMRMSGLAAQHLRRTTALNLYIGVTDTDMEASVAAALCTTSDAQSQSRGLSKQAN